MYAVIKTGGKQYKVASGDVVKLEKIAGEEGKEVVFNEVLALDDRCQEPRPVEIITLPYWCFAL